MPMPTKLTDPTHISTSNADPLSLTTIKPTQSHLYAASSHKINVYDCSTRSRSIHLSTHSTARIPPLVWIKHSDSITSLAINVKSNLFSFFYSVSTSDLRCVESVKAHKDAVSVVMVSEDEMVTGSADKQIWVWAKPFSTPPPIWEKFFLCFFFLGK